MALIAGGTALGQLLAIAAAPLLSRLFTPAEFGLFTVLSAVAMTLGTVVALRLELAIPLPERDRDAAALLVAGGVACGVLTICLAAAAAGAAGIVQPTWEGQEITWLIAGGVPLVAGTFASFRLLNQWALRHHNYVATARRNVVSAVATVVLQVAAGLKGLGAGGLLAGQGSGQAAGALALLRGSGVLSLRTTRQRVWEQVGRYRRFPLVLAPSGFVNAAGVYAPVVLFAVLYGAQAAGWLGFTQRILSVPVTLLGQAIAQVYLSELAGSRRGGKGREHRLFWLATKRLLVVGLALATPLWLLGPTLFDAIFGDVWRTSGDMARALAVALAAQLLGATLSQTLIVYERTGLQLTWDVARLALTLSAVTVGFLLDFSAVSTVWLFAIASAVAYSVLWLLSRNQIAGSSTTDWTEA